MNNGRKAIKLSCNRNDKVLNLICANLLFDSIVGVIYNLPKIAYKLR